jgi:hypothetical protein
MFLAHPLQSNKLSICDTVLSVVRRQSFVRPCVNFFFELPLLQYRLLEFNNTWQACSLQKASPKLFKELNFLKNYGYHGNQKSFFPEGVKPLYLACNMI